MAATHCVNLCIPVGTEKPLFSFSHQVLQGIGPNKVETLTFVDAYVREMSATIQILTVPILTKDQPKFKKSLEDIALPSNSPFQIDIIIPSLGKAEQLTAAQETFCVMGKNLPTFPNVQKLEYIERKGGVQIPGGDKGPFMAFIRSIIAPHFSPTVQITVNKKE